MKFFKEIKQPVAEASRPDAYQRDEINATSGFGKNSYAYQMDGGANDEDHEGDRRREQQVQSGTWYIRLNGKLIKDKTGKPYSYNGKADANKAALTMQAKLFNQGKEFMLTTNPNDKPQGVAEGMAQDEAEEYSGWRAELVNQIKYNTFEVKMTNTRSKESANFIVRPVDMISHGPTLAIETMDVHDLQTGRTESWTSDDPAPDGPIVYAISGLFYDNKELQKKLWTIADQSKDQDMMPGLDQRRSIGQEVDADAYIDSHEKTQATMAKMKKGVAEGLKQTLRKFDPTIKARIRQKSQDQTDQGIDTIQHLADLDLTSDDMVSRAMKPNTYFKNAERYAKLANKGVAEGIDSDSPVAGAITRRILLQRSDLLSKYGPVLVTQAIDEVADFVGDVEEIGSSDVSGWIKQVEQMLANNPPEAFGEDVAEASLAQMRDYFNKPDGSTQVTRGPATAGKNPAGVPQEIQNLINKMYHSGKVTPEEFKILQDFQRKTKINVGIKEATTGNAGYDSMLAVMKAVDAGQDATFDLGGESITLDYNEARFLAGRYKAFLKAGRQEEFLKYMENPMAFDRLMKQLRDLMDKQKNFKGSVQGERGIEEGRDSKDVEEFLHKVARSGDNGFDLLYNAQQGKYGREIEQAIQDMYDNISVDTGYHGDDDFEQIYDRMLDNIEADYSQQGMAERMKSLPPVNENEYWCKIDSVAKPIPEGYKRTANGYITRA